MRILCSLVLIIMFVSIVNGQVNSFQLSYGGNNNDIINSVIPLNEKGFILFGTTSNFSANRTDLILARINDRGEILWINRYGGPQDETAEHIELTGDGGYILSASTTSYGAGNSDLLIIKTDANGIVEWSHTYGGSGSDVASCIKEVTTGGYIVAGRTQSFGQGGDDGYLIRINDQGNVIWSNSYGTNYNERFYYVNNTNDGGFIITGIENTSNFSRYDQLIIRTDNLGNIIFNNSYGDNGGRANDASDCIRQTSDGGYAFSGHFQSYGQGGLDLALTKINATGNIEWSRVYGNNGDERAWDFQITPANGFLLTGYTSSYGNGSNDALAILTSNDGTIVWSRTYGGNLNEEFNECAINGDSILLVGFTQSIGAGAQDMYIIKTDFAGSLQETCSNINLPAIQNSSITPNVRSINQTIRNLNRLMSTDNPNVRHTPIVQTNIRSTDPCLTTTPVNMINFSFYNEQHVSLYWQTSHEINTNKFIIERSFNGIIFDSIGYVNASNEGEKIQQYKYNLHNSNRGYYRLKILDFDGYYEYSNILYTYADNKSNYVYPTCFENNFTIRVPSKYDLIDINIVDINGIQRHKKTYSNEDTISINTTSWPQGIFILKIMDMEGNIFIEKIIKE